LVDRVDTFPKILKVRAREFAHKHAIREKNLGIWQAWSWHEVLDETRALAAGLAAAGFSHGDKFAIVGDNRPHLYWAMGAAQSLGGIPVPMYQDAVADELKFVLAHAEAKFALAEDQEQVDKLLEIKDDCPYLEVIMRQVAG
jgi:long-chain acyl-CoA synthetase